MISKSMAKRLAVQKVPVVTQWDLETLAGLERQITAAKAALARLGTEYAEKEAPVMAALLGDVKPHIEAGEYSVSVDWDIRRSPSYKQWIVKRHGSAIAQKILDETPESKTPFLVLEQKVRVGFEQ